MEGSNILVQLEESLARLDFSEFGLDQETLLERINEVTAVLQSILRADQALAGLDEAAQDRIIPVVLAKDMMYQAALKRAELEANSLLLVVQGELKAEDVGFPEFGATSFEID